MTETIDKKWIIAFAIILGLLLLYSFIYKPYFTTGGKIEKEIKEERMLEEKVLYYACALPKEHKFHRMLIKECNDLERGAEYENSQQDCSPNYMGGCD